MKSYISFFLYPISIIIIYTFFYCVLLLLFPIIFGYLFSDGYNAYLPKGWMLNNGLFLLALLYYLFKNEIKKITKDQINSHLSILFFIIIFWPLIYGFTEKKIQKKLIPQYFTSLAKFSSKQFMDEVGDKYTGPEYVEYDQVTADLQFYLHKDSQCYQFLKNAGYCAADYDADGICDEIKDPDILENISFYSWKQMEHHYFRWKKTHYTNVLPDLSCAKKHKHINPVSFSESLPNEELIGLFFVLEQTFEYLPVAALVIIPILFYMFLYFFKKPIKNEELPKDYKKINIIGFIILFVVIIYNIHYMNITSL